MAFTSTRPIVPGEALPCDLCNQTREWGIFNRSTGKIVCVVCVRTGLISNVVTNHVSGKKGGYARPNDATGAPDPSALKHVFEA